jgi:hypothetical protein
VNLGLALHLQAILAAPQLQIGSPQGFRPIAVDMSVRLQSLQCRQ